MSYLLSVVAPLGRLFTAIIISQGWTLFVALQPSFFSVIGHFLHKMRGHVPPFAFSPPGRNEKTTLAVVKSIPFKPKREQYIYT